MVVGVCSSRPQASSSVEPRAACQSTTNAITCSVQTSESTGLGSSSTSYAAELTKTAGRGCDESVIWIAQDVSPHKRSL